MTHTGISVEGEYLGGHVKLFRMPRHADERGSLMPIHLSQLPFQAVRAFIVDGVPAGMSRGGHAHRTTRQLMVLASGSVRIDLRREGEEISVMLDEARNAVLIEPAIWSRQTYLTADSRIVVFADEEYDPASYVSDEQK